MLDEHSGANEAVARASDHTAPATLQLFDDFCLHPSIVEASRSLFADGHYAPAILEAFKRVEIQVKDVSGLNCPSGPSGKALMAKAFNERTPKIRLNSLTTQSECDEQEGFRFIFMGSMQGIRNPKAHDAILQNDPYKTLEYLGLASLLLKRVDEREKRCRGEGARD